MSLRASPLRSLRLIALVLGYLLLSHLWITRATPLVGEISPDRHYIAQVIARRAFPYLSPHGYLQVVDTDTQATVFKTLFSADGGLQGVISRIRGIRWRGNSVEFDLDDEHYTGPRVFVTPRASVP